MPESQENKVAKVENLVKPPTPKVVQPPQIQTPQMAPTGGVASPLPEQQSDPLEQFEDKDPLAQFDQDPLAQFEDDHTLTGKLRKMLGEAENKFSEIQGRTPTGLWSPFKDLYDYASIPSEVITDELVNTVHSVQDKIGWDEAKTKSVSANMVLNIGREIPGVAAEFTGMLADPISLGTMGYGKGVSMVGKSQLGKETLVPAMDATIDYMAGKIPKWIRKPFTYKFGLPNKQEYIELAEKKLRDVKGFLSLGSDTGHLLHDGLTPEAQKFAKEIMEGKFSADEIERMSLMTTDFKKQFGIEDPSKFFSDIKKARSIVDEVSETFVKEGLKSKFISEKTAETIMNNRGKYLPRLYEIFENPQLRDKIRSGKMSLENAMGTIEEVGDFLKNHASYTDDQVTAFAALGKREQNKILSDLGREVAKKGPFKKPATGWLNSLRKKGDLDIAQQQARKVIETPAYLATKHVQQTGEAAMNLRFFGEIAENPNWVAKPKGIMGEDWVAIPKDKKFGAISGKWVRKEIAEDIVSLNQNTTNAHGVYKFISRANKIWKANKILFSPATHARNIISNSILLDLSGVPLYKTPGLLNEALDQVLKKGPIYKEAVQHNLIGSGFSKKELDIFLPPTNEFSGMNIGQKVSKGWRGMYETAGNVYATEEEIFKIAKYMHEVRSGKTQLEAAAEAEKWLFNYNKVSKATEFFRDNPVYNIPFITFAVKSTPRIAEAALKNPFKLYKYNMFIDAVNNQSAQAIGMNETDLKYIKSKKGIGVLMPERDENGDPMWMSLRSIIPWADYHDYAKEVTQGKSDIPSAIQPGGVVKIAGEIAFNKEMFSGKEVYKEGKSVPLQIGAKIWRDFAPPLNPIPFGTSGEENIDSVGYQAKKLGDAMYSANVLPESLAIAINAKKAGYYGASKSVPFAVLDVFLGLSIQPIQESVLIKMDVSDLKAGLKDAKNILLKSARDQGIDENTEAGRHQMEVAERQMEEQLDRVLEQWEKLHP